MSKIFIIIALLISSTIADSEQSEIKRLNTSAKQARDKGDWGEVLKNLQEVDKLLRLGKNLSSQQQMEKVRSGELKPANFYFAYGEALMKLGKNPALAIHNFDKFFELAPRSHKYYAEALSYHKKAKNLYTKPMTFQDSRDGQEYQYRKIGNQHWMVQNLNYKSKDSRCYEDKKSNCKIHGRLYTAQSAQQVCPTGWHLPSDNEWFELGDFVIKNIGVGRFKKGKRSDSFEEVGTVLKSISMNGTDDVGFGGLLSGYSTTHEWRGKINVKYSTLGYHSYYWTSTSEYAKSIGGKQLQYFVVYNLHLTSPSLSRAFKTEASDRRNPVRCIRNN